jgi:ABC-2 type transport system ATP-binding protein
MTLAIETIGLTKTYNGRIRALEGIDLRVTPAEVFAFLGPNGSGKTTLMRILTTQFRPTSGEARAFGLDVVRRGADVRRMIGYVPQETSVWLDISGRENLLIYSKIYGVPKEQRKSSIEEAIQTMGLEEDAGRMVKAYSGGMTRRLEIAAALLVKPRILFLDEPTIGLDPSARKAVWESLTALQRERGTTVFFNTHYMDEADHYSDEIAIINRGRIVKSGTATELKRSLRGEILQFSRSRREGEEEVHGQNGFSESALKKVREVDLVQDAVVSGPLLDVFVDDGERALPLVMEVLRSEGATFDRISTARPTLDDVFLKYAGPLRSGMGGDGG